MLLESASRNQVNECLAVHNEPASSNEREYMVQAIASGVRKRCNAKFIEEAAVKSFLGSMV